MKIRKLNESYEERRIQRFLDKYGWDGPDAGATVFTDYYTDYVPKGSRIVVAFNNGISYKDFRLMEKQAKEELPQYNVYAGAEQKDVEEPTVASIFFDKKEISESISENYDPKKNYKFSDYTNFWTIIDDETVDGVHYCMFENNKWGDETCYLVADLSKAVDKEKIFKDGHKEIIGYFDCDTTDVYETYDDIHTCLEDEDIIKEDSIIEQAITEETNESTINENTYSSSLQRKFQQYADAKLSDFLNGWDNCKNLISKLTYGSDENISINSSFFSVKIPKDDENLINTVKDNLGLDLLTAFENKARTSMKKNNGIFFQAYDNVYDNGMDCYVIYLRPASNL